MENFPICTCLVTLQSLRTRRDTGPFCVMSADPRSTDAEDNDPDASCQIGLVHGLVGRADLNGHLARAVRWIETRGRWALIMDGGEKVLVRDENIDFQAPEAIEVEANTPIVATGLPFTSSPVVGTAIKGEQPAHPADPDAADDAPSLTLPPPPPVVVWLCDLARCFCLPLAATAKHTPLPPRGV